MFTKLLNVIVVNILVIPMVIANSSFNNSNPNSTKDFDKNLFVNALICPTVEDSYDNDVGSCDAMIVILGPTSGDTDCVIDVITNDYNNTADASDVYPVGMTTVTFTVTFTNGMTESCSVDIVVVDAEDPVPSCNDVTVELGPNGMVDLDLDALSAGSSDNCPGLMVTASTDFSACNNIGIDLEVTLTYEDAAGNTADCVAIVTTEDNLPPVLTCPPTILVDACDATTIPDALDFAAFEAAGGSFMDNCSTIPVDFALVSETTDGVSCPETVTRIYQAEDDSGNIATCEQLIIVSEDEAPVWDFDGQLELTLTTELDDADCPLDAELGLSVGDEIITTDTWIAGGVEIESLAGFVSDNCTAEEDLIIRVTAITANGLLCERILTITFEAEDDCGNIAGGFICTYTFIDDTPPVMLSTPVAIDPINCGDPLPPVETLTAMDNCTDVVFTIDTVFTEDICAGYEVTYNYLAEDMCGNVGMMESVTFMVLPDGEAPTIVCADVTAENDELLCAANLTLPIPAVTDVCSSVTITNDYSISNDITDDFPVGTTEVTWTAIDNCGNEEICVQTITVTDTESPEITCNPDLAVYLNNLGDGMVFPSMIVLGATDNCHIGDMFIRRMDDACGNPDDLQEGESIQVCCSDIGSPLTVIASVYDTSGNVAECMVEVQVFDKLAPIVQSELPDITVSCDFLFDMNDLSVFGSYVTSDPQDIIIEDPFYTAPDFIAGQDGLIQENCPDGLTIDEISTADLVCGQGEIIRSFVFTDEDGNNSEGSQSIFIQDLDPFVEGDITWPGDITYNNCSEVDLDTITTGSPMFFVDNCNQVMASYEDLIFDANITGCPVIQRNWSVIDWCSYVPNDPNSVGLYTHTQVIRVLNTVPPTLASPVDTVICANDNTCLGDVTLSASATDDCSDAVDFEFWYSFDVLGMGTNVIEGAGTNLSLTDLPLGEHILIWGVEDGCGNISNTTIIVEIQECSAPTPVCINGLSAALVPGMGMVEIWAVDVNASSVDNCTATEDLVYSFSSDTTDTNAVFDCNTLGSQPIELWVTDEAGNQNHCTTFIDIQDNSGECPALSTSVNIAGNVRTEEEQPVMGTQMYITNGEMEDMYITEQEGVYAFMDLDMYNSYNLNPAMEGDILDGVSTLDLAMIQRHILGLVPLDSPYKLIASDINNSGDLTAIDLVELRKVILGIYDEFPGNKNWNFIPANYNFIDAYDPFPYPSDIDYQDLSHDEMYSDFIAIKTGDVNGSNGYNLLDNHHVESRAPVEFILSRELGDSRIAVRARGFSNIIGMQFSLLNATEINSIEGAQLEISDHNIYNNGNTIQLSWSTPNSVIATEEDILFYINSEMDIDEIAFSTERMEAEVYDVSYGKSAIRMSTDDNVLSYTLYQNVPNPFNRSTDISFSIPTDDWVTIEILDMNGASIHKVRSFLKEGKHNYNVNAVNLGINYSGIYFYRMTCNKFSDVKKMMLIR
jgi:hypothetical protein